MTTPNESIEHGTYIYSEDINTTGARPTRRPVLMRQYLSNMGRKSKLTPELQSRLVQSISEGNTIENSCNRCNIHPDTFYSWMQRANDDPANVYTAFSTAIKSARAEAEAYHVANIKKAGDKIWTASAWYLERSNPDKWALRKPAEPTAPAHPIVENEGASASNDAFRTFMKQLISNHPELKDEMIELLKAVSR